MMGMNRPKNITNAVDKFQKGVLSLNPSKPEPLPAAEDTYSCSIVVNP